MCPNDLLDNSLRVTIAGVRFTLSGAIGNASFPPPFQPFLQPGIEADLTCDIFAAGPDAALAALPDAPGHPWTFTLDEQKCAVVRRDDLGRILWRMTGSPGFTEIRITWHPLLFDAYYGSYQQAWSMGLGLTVLGMRLRAAGGLLFHGTAAVLDGKGILCVGVSGVGKSTLSRILTAAGATVLTDERPTARLWPSPDHAFRVYGTPWPSSAAAARSEWAPLHRLYLLAHGAVDQITPLASQEAVRQLIPVTTIPWQTPRLLDPFLATLDALVREVPCAHLAFRPTNDVVATLRADLCRAEKDAMT